MRIKASTLVWALLAIGVVVWAVQWWGSDERQLRGRLGELQGLIAKEAGESDLAGVNNARLLGELLSERFELHLEPYAGAISDRQQLQQVFFGYRSSFDRISIDLNAEQLVVDPATRLGSMEVLASLTGDRKGGGLARERYRLGLAWVEDRGEWRLQRVELLEVLEGPAGLL